MAKVALVNGGSRGIGRAIVLELARNDYRLAFNYRSDKRAAELLHRRLRRQGVDVICEQQDSGDYAGVEAFVKRVIRRFGHIDVLVNNAGVAIDAPLYLMEETEWDTVITTNLKGTYNFCRACVAHMMRRKRGRIINIASVSGLQGVAGQTNYCASKGALIAFSKALAKEVAPFNITTNVIAPGFVETDMVGALRKETRVDYQRRIPLGRFGKVQEVAEIAQFLADKANYVTGQTIVIDGGLLA